MQSLLIILLEALVIFVGMGVAGFAVLLILHHYGERVAASVEREVPSRPLADMMIGTPPSQPVLPRDLSDRQVDRLARHLEIKIVDPAEPVVLLGDSSSLRPARREGDPEAASHAERGRR